MPRSPCHWVLPRAPLLASVVLLLASAVLLLASVVLLGSVVLPLGSAVLALALLGHALALLVALLTLTPVVLVLVLARVVRLVAPRAIAMATVGGMATLIGDVMGHMCTAVPAMPLPMRAVTTSIARGDTGAFWFATNTR